MASNREATLAGTKSARAGSTSAEGNPTVSDTTRIIGSIFASVLTVGVALAALILTSANDTRRQFNEQVELMRLNSDSKLEQLHGDIREVRGDVREVRGEVREVRGEVRALAERVARLEGLLLAGREPGLAPPAEAMGADSSASPTGPRGSERR